MCADEIDVGMVVPNYDVFSGGVERTLKLLEYSDAGAIRYTAYLPRAGVPNREVGDAFKTLAGEGKVVLRELGDGVGRHDVIAVPTEYWWQAWKRGRAGGLRGPYCFDFHQLPYIGTLDILKSVGIDQPALHDLVRFPFVQARRYADGFFLSTFQTAACVVTVRSFPRLRDGRIMAVTPVVAKNLASLGYRGPMFVPECPNAIARPPIEESLAGDPPLEFDGVYVGRFHPHKGFLDLPYVVAEMKRILKRDVNVAVCGSSHFPRHRARFDRLVRALGIERNLTVLGRVSRSELYRTIRRSKMLLYPSYVDGFSLTVLESLCLGVPVVAYNIDALELIWSRRDGVFRGPVGDTRALAELAATIQTGDRLEEARRAARAQSRDLLEKYTWENVVRDERTFYEGACEGAAG